jgi:hypothetical protein
MERKKNPSPSGGERVGERVIIIKRALLPVLPPGDWE